MGTERLGCVQRVLTSTFFFSKLYRRQIWIKSEEAPEISRHGFQFLHYNAELAEGCFRKLFRKIWRCSCTCPTCTGSPTLFSTYMMVPGVRIMPCPLSYFHAKWKKTSSVGPRGCQGGCTRAQQCKGQSKGHWRLLMLNSSVLA